MAEWGFLGKLIEDLTSYSTMLGRFWLLLVLIFRIMILGIVASDMFEDEQEEFVCNTQQPGCKQVCYDMAFPISQYRYWVFHIVLIAAPSMGYLVYAMHHNNKTSSSKYSQSSSQEDERSRRLKCLYIVSVVFRVVAEVGALVGQWWLYGFKVEPQYVCSRFPCPHTVDCFISRPTEKTVFLCFYFMVGVISVLSSCVEIIYAYTKWFCRRGQYPTQGSYVSQNFENSKQEEAERMKSMSESTTSTPVRTKSVRGVGPKRVYSIGNKRRNGRTLMV